MKINAKALLIGLVAVLALSVLTTLVVSFYLVDMYSASISSGRYSPLYVSYTVVLALLQFGIPGYLAATIAKTSAVLHAFIVGLVGSLVVIALSWSNALEHPLLTIMTFVFSTLVATLAGKLRQYQVTGT